MNAIARSIAVAAGLAGAAVGAWAQSGTDYPTRSVRMVVPFAPGGASDIVGRIIGPRLSQQFGQQVGHLVAAGRVVFRRQDLVATGRERLERMAHAGLLQRQEASVHPSMQVDRLHLGHAELAADHGAGNRRRN